MKFVKVKKIVRAVLMSGGNAKKIGMIRKGVDQFYS